MTEGELLYLEARMERHSMTGAGDVADLIAAVREARRMAEMLHKALGDWGVEADEDGVAYLRHLTELERAVRRESASETYQSVREGWG